MSNEKNSATGNKIIAILLMVGGGALIFIGIFFRLNNSEILAGDSTGLLTMLAFSVIGLGIFLVIISPIIFYIKSERQKKLNSISETDLAKMFECPVSGNKGAVHLIKLVKDQIIVKQRCPNHLEKVLRIPLRLKDQCVSYFRGAVFRCFKCGQEATVDLVKFSGPWTLIKLSCPTHGNKLPTHKIWSSVYAEISNEGG